MQQPAEEWAAARSHSSRPRNVLLLLPVFAAGRFDLLESTFHYETANYHRPLSQVQVTEFFGSVSNVQTLQACGDYNGTPAVGEALLGSEAGDVADASSSNSVAPVNATTNDSHAAEQQQQQQQPRDPAAGPDLLVLAGFAGLCAVAVLVSIRS